MFFFALKAVNTTYVENMLVGHIYGTFASNESANAFTRRKHCIGSSLELLRPQRNKPKRVQSENLSWQRNEQRKQQTRKEKVV